MNDISYMVGKNIKVVFICGRYIERNLVMVFGVIDLKFGYVIVFYFC